MAKFVTLDDVKARLRVDTSDDDASLEGLIEGATGIVVNHLKAAAQPLLESGATIPPAVQTATIMLVGYLYRNPDQDPDGAFGDGMLPGPVRVILHPLRDPSMA